MVVEDQRPFLLGFQLLLLLLTLLLALQVDLVMVRKEREMVRHDRDLPLLCSSKLCLQIHIIKWLPSEHLLHASKALWRHLLLILQVGKLRLKELEQLV